MELVIGRPIVDEFDLSGWELRKALRLFRKSNPPLIEWLGSPIVYRERTTLASRLHPARHRPPVGSCRRRRSVTRRMIGDNRSKVTMRLIRVEVQTKITAVMDLRRGRRDPG